jgi:hypothetical protein
LVILLLLVGGYLIYVGLTSEGEAEDAPLPTPIAIDPSAPPPTVTETIPAPGAVADDPDATEINGPMAPNRLRIPNLGISAKVVLVGAKNGDYEVPSDLRAVGLYKDGGMPCGTQGTVLLAGHVTYNSARGVLYPLSTIKANEIAYVSCDDGTITRWRLVKVTTPDRMALPQDIFSATGDLRLVIVTCGGKVVNGSYSKNVIAEFIPFPEEDEATASPTPSATPTELPTASDAPSESATEAPSTEEEAPPATTQAPAPATTRRTTTTKTTTTTSDPPPSMAVTFTPDPDPPSTSKPASSTQAASSKAATSATTKA